MTLVVRLSPGTEPVLEIHAADLRELDASLRGMRTEGVWSALKGAAREFADAPLAAIEAVEAMLPGAQVIADSGGDPPFEPDPPVDLAAEAAVVKQWNQSVRDREANKGFLAPEPTAPDEDIVINAGPATKGPVNTAPLAF